MLKRKISAEDKIAVVKLYRESNISQRGFADRCGVSLSSAQQWIRNYESMGTETFTRKGNKAYSRGVDLKTIFAKNMEFVRHLNPNAG